MSVREQNLATISPVLATFKISQTDDVDDLKDTNIGEPVTLVDDYAIGPVVTDGQVLGKLISLTLSDNDNGQRLATVQIGGICTLSVSATVPSVGDRVVGGANATVKQAPSGTVPEGGHIGRGVVLAVSGTSDCVVFLN